MQEKSSLLYLSGIGMILVGFLCIYYWKRKNNVVLSCFIIGGIIWGLSVMLKGGAYLATKSFLLSIARGSNIPLPLFIFFACLYSGLLTSFFECGVPLIFILKTKLKNYNWNQAIAFGIGAGAFEAILVGIGTLFLTYALLTNPERLPEILRRDLIGNDLYAIPAPIIERFFTLIMHTAQRVLIFYAVISKKWKFFWAAFLFMTAVDAFALPFAMGIITSVKEVYIVEAVIFLFGILGYKIIKDLKIHYERI